MPYRRVGYFLTPPSIFIFALSLIIAILAWFAAYGGVALIVSRGNAFTALTIAYLLLVAGVVIRGI